MLAREIGRVATGDRTAFGNVYRMTSAKLYGIVIRILGDRAEAEDVLQEVYLTVWRRAGDYDPAIAAPVTWMVAIARNRAIDRLRALRVVRTPAEIEAILDIEDPGPSPQERVAREQDRHRLDDCLDTLPEVNRLAIRAAFFGGLTYEEAAIAAGVPLGTMKSWIRRGLISLRGCLER